MTINGVQIQQWIERFLAGVHVDEHTALLILIGIVIGAILFHRGGYHRRAYGAYRRWRGYY